jgi:subtilisin family serine protease
VSATGPTSTLTPFGPFNNVDAPAFYTNFGLNAIDVAAPGGNAGPIATDPEGGWIYAACSRTSLVIPGCRPVTSELGVMGTSQAAPHVAALAALLVEDHGFNNPLDIRRRIQRTSADLGPVGKDAFYGHGRIDAAKALRVPKSVVAN